MFRNAEYRLGISQTLSNNLALAPAAEGNVQPKIKGMIHVKLGE